MSLVHSYKIEVAGQDWCKIRIYSCECGNEQEVTDDLTVNVVRVETEGKQ